MRCERKEGTPPEMFECVRCGKPFKLQPHGIGLPVYRECKVMGLGDYVAAGLERIGVAPLVRRIRGGCGGCKKRQKLLNELGDYLLPRK